MLNSLTSASKVVGVVIFIGVAVSIACTAIFTERKNVPTELQGCYRASSGQLAILSRNSIVVDGSEFGDINVDFDRTNLWDQLAPDQDIIAQLKPDGTMVLVPETPGRIISISPSEITFYLGNKKKVAFGRSRCEKRV